MAEKGKNPSNVPLPAPELTTEERKALYAKAVETVQQELKDAEAARILKEYEKDVRRRLVPEEELIPVLIDVAGHADRITIDGTQYFQGVTYSVPQVKAATIREIMARTWKHEREIGGANGNAYRQPRNLTLSPNSPVPATMSHLMRV